jgi:3-isopropylmalate dehydratase small subunit
MEAGMNKNSKIVNGIRIRGSAHVFGNNINTDIHCSNKYMPGKDIDFIAEHAFDNIDSSFVSRFNKGDVIVAGINFGNNSSREQAAQVMRHMGVAAVVACSFARQFYRNAINNGLPIIECDTTGIETGDIVEVVLESGRVSVADKNIHRQSHPLPSEIVAIISAGGLLSFLQENPDWSK